VLLVAVGLEARCLRWAMMVVAVQGAPRFDVHNRGFVCAELKWLARLSVEIKVQR
jgi:hypothetical protein